jgi:hypothetical protein
MNLPIVLISLGATFLLLEGVFFLYCFRWLSSGKKNRERELSKLDQERAELVQLQGVVSQTLKNSEKLAKDTQTTLARLGADAHAEYNDMFAKMNELLNEVDVQSTKIAKDTATMFQKNKLNLEKLVFEAQTMSTLLSERTLDARKTLCLLDKNTPTEVVMSEIQQDKYAKARNMLLSGKDATEIGKSLGISQSELALLSFMS